MIKIFRDRAANRLTISGHAGTAPKGEDLVCASVTTLAATLAVNLMVLKDRGVVDSVDETMEDGYADISCTTTEAHYGLICIIYDTICMGLAELAKAHPDCVEYHSK